MHDLLKGFRGVLVSDFYAAYDSLDCPQQKCLIHLIRDFNQDIQRHPWDEELKALASKLGSLLRGIVATVDQHGLRRRHLTKHKGAVDRFFESFAVDAFRSKVAEAYRERLLKCREKLFTFLDHDGVPWNNNPAEHAVKQFAYYREHVDGQITENGLNGYLVLLSICLTCKYKGINFLRFLSPSRRATTDMRSRSTGVRQDFLVVAATFFEGVGKDRKAVEITAAVNLVIDSTRGWTTWSLARPEDCIHRGARRWHGGLSARRSSRASPQRLPRQPQTACDILHPHTGVTTDSKGGKNLDGLGTNEPLERCPYIACKCLAERDLLDIKR